MKTCTKCGEAKAEAEFSKRKDSEDGLRGQCRVCHKAVKVAWYEANREKVDARNTAWKKANPDKVLAAGATYREANPEKVNAASATYRKENPEKVAARNAAWLTANPEKQRAAVAAWNKANPDKKRTYLHNYRARKRANGGTLSPDIVEIKMKAQGGLCTCCGLPLTEWHIDHIDHIVPVAKGGPNTDGNVQLLLPRCNQRKGAKTMDEYMQHRKAA